MDGKKLEHEEAMEVSKDMLDKGIGMGKIKEKTGLNQKDIKKSKFNMNNK